MSEKTKIDRNKLVEALGEGLTLEEAAKEAGSKAHTYAGRAGVAANTLKRNPRLKKDVLDLLEDKRKMTFKALTKQKMDRSTGYQLVTMTAILTDKIQLLKGLPTARMEGTIDFKHKKQGEIKAWLQSKLTSK